MSPIPDVIASSARALKRERLIDLFGNDRLRVGSCLIEITDVRIPCSNLKKWDADLPELIVGRSGWVAKVVEEGEVKPGDPIEVVRKT